MTKGGPLDSTLSIAIYTYNQFGFGNYGYASAASYVLFVAIVLLRLVQFRLLRRTRTAMTLSTNGPSRRPNPSRRRRHVAGTTPDRRRRTRGWLHRLGLGLVALLPFVWMVLGSFKTEGEIRQSRRTCCRRSRRCDNYADAVHRLNIGTFFVNSLVVARVTARQPGVLLHGRLRAGQDGLPRQALLFLLVMVTLMVPGVVTFVPLFVLVPRSAW